MMGERQQQKKKKTIMMESKESEKKERTGHNGTKKCPHRQNSCGDSSTGSIMTRWILFDLFVLYCWGRLVAHCQLSWIKVGFFLFKTLRVPHGLLLYQQGKVEWQTVGTSRGRQHHCPCQKNPENSRLQAALSLVVSFSRSRSFSSKMAAAPQAAAAQLATISCLKATCRRLCQPAARLRDGNASRGLPGFRQSSRKLMWYVFCVQADPGVAFVVKVLGRVGVHSLSQVLSTVLVLYFIFCFDVVMI